MKIKEAINRIYWRFGGNDNSHPFPVNEKDVEAYNVLAKVVEENQKQQFRNNELFAKLFIFTYKRMFELEGGNIMDQGMTAKRRKIYHLLQKPVPQLIEEFKDMLNDSEVYELYASIEVENKHPALQIEQARVSNMEKLQKALKTPENKSKFLREVWDYDVVAECLESEVNQAIELWGKK